MALALSDGNNPTAVISWAPHSRFSSREIWVVYPGLPLYERNAHMMQCLLSNFWLGHHLKNTAERLTLYWAAVRHYRTPFCSRGTKPGGRSEASVALWWDPLIGKVECVWKLAHRTLTGLSVRWAWAPVVSKLLLCEGKFRRNMDACICAYGYVCVGGCVYVLLRGRVSFTQKKNGCVSFHQKNNYSCNFNYLPTLLNRFSLRTLALLFSHQNYNTGTSFTSINNMATFKFFPLEMSSQTTFQSLAPPTGPRPVHRPQCCSKYLALRGQRGIEHRLRAKLERT